MTWRTVLARARRHLTFANILLVALLVWATPRLLPHLGALVGVRSGPDTTPAYAWRTLDGHALTADSLRGHVVLVNVWATWCTPCRVEMPLLEQMHKRHTAAGLTVIGLAMDRAATATVESFVRDRGITYPIVHAGPDVASPFLVRGYPTSFLIDRTGRVRHTLLGPIGPLSLEPAVRRLLDER